MSRAPSPRRPRTSSAARPSILAAALAAACGGEADRVEVVVDTFNAGLAGVFIPHAEERAPAVADAVAGLEADLVCLQELWLQEDKDAVISAAAEAFPHALSFEHDLSTPADDPTRQDGVLPDEPTEAPCAGEALGAVLEDVVGCLEAACSSNPGGGDARATSVTCAQRECLGAAMPLLVRDVPSLRCYGCLATTLPTETFATMRAECSSNPLARHTFGGQSGVVLLSRHPLEGGEVTVLPSTWSRRTVVSATAELPELGELDVHCAQLTPVFDSVAFPYTGDYGEGSITAGGWEAEQRLQAERLVRIVEERSAGRPAVIVGNLNAGRGFGSDVGVDIVDVGLPTARLLEGAFDPAVPPDYVPACTLCADNPLTIQPIAPVWVDHVYLAGARDAAVSEAVRILTEPSVPVGDAAVPLSDHYGLRSTIRFAR